MVRSRRRQLAITMLVVSAFLTPVLAQQPRLRVRAGQAVPGSAAATNPIDAARLPSGSTTLPDSIWAAAGATIPTSRTQCGATITAYSGTAGTINTAIGSCGSGHYVLLGAGTFTLSTGIKFDGTSDVTLRGNGANSTFLVFTNDDPCQGQGCFIGMDASDLSAYSGNPPSHIATVNSGAIAKGATTATLSITTGLAVGRMMWIDRPDDSNTDNGAIWVCQTAGGVCADEGPSGSGRTGRAQSQNVTVTAINGSVVTFTPAIAMPNYTSSTEAYWGNSAGQVSNIGIEDFSIQHPSTDTNTSGGIDVKFCSNCWIKGIRSYEPDVAAGDTRNHVWVYQSNQITIRDSYFFNTQRHAQLSYGIECFSSSSILVENNIFQRIVAPMNANGACTGSVFGYNYAINDYSTNGTFMQASNYVHAVANMVLHEGNDGVGIKADAIHGTSHFVTLHRNFMLGFISGGYDTETNAVLIYAGNRYYNFTGNVLGDTTYHTVYETSLSNNAFAIWSWGRNGCASGCATDTKVLSTAMRWGNYDTKNDAVQWTSGEVPSTDPNYPNAVPSSQTVPNSYYLSAKPAFYGSNNWPSIGPEISDGTISGYNGHIRRIPARICFEDVMAGAFGDTTPKTFNRTTCYP
jgi:hypothetical protein